MPVVVNAALFPYDKVQHAISCMILGILSKVLVAAVNCFVYSQLMTAHCCIHGHL